MQLTEPYRLARSLEFDPSGPIRLHMARPEASRVVAYVVPQGNVETYISSDIVPL